MGPQALAPFAPARNTFTTEKVAMHKAGSGRLFLRLAPCIQSWQQMESVQRLGSANGSMEAS